MVGFLESWLVHVGCAYGEHYTTGAMCTTSSGRFAMSSSSWVISSIGILSCSFVFRSAVVRTGTLATIPMGQADVYRMIGRRALNAYVKTRIGCHSFRAAGSTEYLRKGGKLEVAQQMENHESARTSGLYDRRQDQVSLDEVERILI